jgi:hypothetical protein
MPSPSVGAAGRIGEWPNHPHVLDGLPTDQNEFASVPIKCGKSRGAQRASTPTIGMQRSRKWPKTEVMKAITARLSARRAKGLNAVLLFGAALV